MDMVSTPNTIFFYSDRRIGIMGHQSHLNRGNKLKKRLKPTTSSFWVISHMIKTSKPLLSWSSLDTMTAIVMITSRKYFRSITSILSFKLCRANATTAALIRTCMPLFLVCRTLWSLVCSPPLRATSTYTLWQSGKQSICRISRELVSISRYQSLS